MIYLILLAMSGSFMVSYTKARAEALGPECAGGLMQRPERIVLLGGGSLLFGLMWEGKVISIVVIVVALLTNFTVVQRIVLVQRRASGVSPEPVSRLSVASAAVATPSPEEAR